MPGKCKSPGNAQKLGPHLAFLDQCEPPQVAADCCGSTGNNVDRCGLMRIAVDRCRLLSSFVFSLYQDIVGIDCVGFVLMEFWLEDSWELDEVTELPVWRSAGVGL